MPLFLQSVIDQLGVLAIFLAVGAVEIIKGNQEFLEIPHMFLANLFYQFDRFNPVLLGFQHDWRAMCIRSTNEVAFVSRQTLKPCPDIGLDIFQHMPQMDLAICIGQSTGKQNSPGRFR